MKEILLTSAKEVNCYITLVESFKKLDEVVVVHAKVNKQRPLNSMALIGGRMISVKEANTPQSH